MSKVLKDMISSDLKSRYEGVESACVVDVTRMDVGSVVKLRTSLREKGAKVEVIKNSLARRAFEGGPLEPISKALDGPCAIVTGGENVIEIAKFLVTQKKAYETLELKNAIVDGDESLLTVDQLSKMKGRLELLSDIAGLISSPGRALAGAIRSPGAKIAGCLKAMAEKDSQAD